MTAGYVYVSTTERPSILGHNHSTPIHPTKSFNEGTSKLGRIQKSLKYRRLKIFAGIIAAAIVISAVTTACVLLLRPDKNKQIKHAFNNVISKKQALNDGISSIDGLQLEETAPDAFQSLRKLWNMEKLWQSETKDPSQFKLKGGLGLSGSTFLYTPNKEFIIKSIDREFEFNQFWDRMLNPYISHMHANPDSLLTKIAAAYKSPENPDGKSNPAADVADHWLAMHNFAAGDQWTEKPWDLKPAYWSIDRDMLRRNPDGLADNIEDYSITLRSKDKAKIMTQLRSDLGFLSNQKVIDYSLFVARTNDSKASGYKSLDGKTIYRLGILDFSFNTPLILKAVSKMSFLPDQTTTADPNDYRKKFIEAVDTMIKSD